MGARPSPSELKDIVKSTNVPFVLAGMPEIRVSHLRPRRLRFCPTCLAEDGPPEQRIHRQAWQIMQVCACPRHHTLLVENCDECGEPLKQSRKTKPWDCASGRNMTEMARTVAPEGAIAMSLAIMRTLGTRFDTGI